MERRKLDVDLRKLDVSSLDITKHLAYLESDEILNRKLLVKCRTIVCLYTFKAFNLSSRDNGLAIDPYLYLKCNDKVYNERNNY